MKSILKLGFINFRVVFFMDRNCCIWKRRRLHWWSTL